MATQPERTSVASRPLPVRLLETVGKHPDHPALKADGGRGRMYSYGEFGSLFGRLGAGLRRRRLVELPEIGIVSENRPEWAIAYFGILAAGGTAVPIDANFSEKEIDYVVTHSKLRVIFASGKFEQRLRNTHRELTVISFEQESEAYYEKYMDARPEYADVGAYNVAVLIYTSGTTGAPKAVELTHQNIVANMDGVEGMLQFGHGDTFLSILPLHHTFEATCGMIVPMIAGATITYVRSMKSKDILEDLGYNGVTVMCGVPLLYEKMYHSIMRAIEAAPRLRRVMFRVLFFVSGLGWRLGQKWGIGLFRSLRQKAGLGTIRLFVSGGSAIPPKISEFYCRIGLTFVQGYGMTECSPVVSVNTPEDIKFGSVGRPLPNLQVRIDLPNEEGIGEIVVQGDSITPGYRNNPEKTAELIRDGWLHTGDLGRFKDGHLWITGRAKNLIISAAGKNIYPEEIEEVLLESTLILEAVVFGRTKDGKQGEEVCAIIVPDRDQLAAEHNVDRDQPDQTVVAGAIKTVVDAANGRMAGYKRIKHYEIQFDELQKTSTQKVKRFAYK